MGVEERILKLLDEVREDGILQSEIPRALNLSKSTVSEILTNFEAKRLVVRKSISARAYRVWKAEHLPFPFQGILRLGILKSSEYAYLIKAAVEKSVLIKLFNDPLALTRSLSQGRVDIAASPLLTQVIMGVLMKNFLIKRIVAKNGSGVVFSGSKVGVFGTTEISTMDRNLRKFISERGVGIRYFSSPQSMIESLRRGEIEGIAIWEPYLTMLREEGFEAIFFDDILGDFICCSLAVNRESFDLNRGTIENFLNHYDRICGKELSKDDLALISKRLGFEDKLVERSLKNYKFCQEIFLDEIRSYLRDSGIDLSEESIRSVF